MEYMGLHLYSCPGLQVSEVGLDTMTSQCLLTLEGTSYNEMVALSTKQEAPVPTKDFSLLLSVSHHPCTEWTDNHWFV